MILSDPLLRLYCAMPRDGSPWPPHPGYPDGTATAAVEETGPQSVWQASEFVLRPLAVVVRIARDCGLRMDIDPVGCGIEVDPAGRPTGRVVVDVVADDGDRAADRSRELLEKCVEQLAERCTTPSLPETRVLLLDVVEQELGGRGRCEPDRFGGLSHARSIADLHLSELSPRPTAQRHGVWLTPAQNKRLIDRLALAAERAGVRTAEGALRWSRGEAEQSPRERIVRLIYRILTRKQFRRGSLCGYPLSRASLDILPFVIRGEPIHLVLPSFPVKMADSGLKALGTLPDLAEFGFLARLKELHAAISGVYEPGIRVTLLTDGRHFRPRSAALTDAYAERVDDYIRMIDGSRFLRLRDIDETAGELLGPQVRDERLACVELNIRALTAAYLSLDIAAEPAAALRRSRELDPAGPAVPGPAVADLFRSLVHSVTVPLPAGADRRDWSRRVYADLYQTGDAVPPAPAADRGEVLRAAWAAAISYVAVLRADREHGYEEMFGARVRLTANTPTPGRCGFAGLGGSALLPWHGTGAADLHGIVSTDFAISLLDRAFVPVYADPLGGDQPWFMAPVTVTEVAGPGPARLSDDFLDSIKLRRE